jgi:predicted metal-binding membrane protein
VSQTWPAARRRDVIAVCTALVGVSALAWVYLVRQAGSMGGMSTGAGRLDMPMDMPGMSMDLVGLRPWTPVDFALTLVMWSVMMVGMMVPSAMPATLLYLGVARKARDSGDVVAPTLFFVGGYVSVWALFSVVATTLQWGLESAALLSEMMVSRSPVLGATLLALAGAYQLTPAKRACLSHCRSPVHFLAHEWRAGAWGAVRMGSAHGLYCLGCCWALMLLLFVGGVMNLLWVAAIALFVLLEKVLPLGRVPSWLAGAAMIGAGLALILRGTG